MKDAGMRIRVEPELREKFVNLCRDNDVPAAQVLRSFMREFVQNNSDKTRSKVAKQLTSSKLDFRKIAPKVDL
jgi:hypothetical protein